MAERKERKKRGEPVTLKFKRLTKNVKLPSFAYTSDAGFDVYSIESKTLSKNEKYAFSTGISSEIPQGFFVSLRDKSGLAANHGLHVLGGVIDSGYRGEWKVILINLGDLHYKVEKGEKIAQGILHKLSKVKIEEVRKQSNSKRGEK